MFRPLSLSPGTISGSLLFACLDSLGRDEVRSCLVVLALSKLVCANPCHTVDLKYLPIINLDRCVLLLEFFHAIFVWIVAKETR
jgi:hypothetical protein